MDVSNLTLEFTRYDQIAWEDSKDTELNCKMLSELGYSSYIDYVFHCIGWYEIFDLPNITLVKIITKIPKKGFSRFLLLSENRLESLKDYVDWKEVSRNKSLTPTLFRKFKDKIDITYYYEIIKLDKNMFYQILRIASKEFDNYRIDKERGKKFIKQPLNRYRVFSNPLVIPFLEKLDTKRYLPLQPLWIEGTQTRVGDFVVDSIIKAIAMNPDINLEVYYSYDYKSSVEYKRQYASNPFLPSDIIEIMKKDYIEDILRKHLLIDEFMEKYGSLYNKYPMYFFMNPSAKITKDMINEKTVKWYKLNPLRHKNWIKNFEK